MSIYAKPKKRQYRYSGYRNMKGMTDVYGLEPRILNALYSRAYAETKNDPDLKGYDEIDYDFDVRLFEAMDALIMQQIMGHDMTQTSTVRYY